MRASWRAWSVGVAAMAMALGGCASTGSPAPVVAALPVTPPAPPPVNYGSFLGGSAGARLPEADRTEALAAETGAIESGHRRSWKGAKGVYGYVEPGPSSEAAAAPAADGSVAGQCRTFTSTIFFGGRPQTGHGTGCQDPDGIWHLTS